MFKISYAEIIGTTVLTPEFLKMITIPEGAQITPAEAVIEYASRLCYDSNDKFGTNPNFIKGLIKAGHLDVLEHSAMAIRVCFDEIDYDYDFYQALFGLQQEFPYLKLEIETDTKRYKEVLIAGNLRTFLEFSWGQAHSESLFGQLWNLVCIAGYIVAPNIFGEITQDQRESVFYEVMLDEYEHIQLAEEDERQFYQWSPEESYKTETGAKVTPLGFMKRRYDWDEMQHISFLVENVSRAFMAQQTRHRLLSHSVMSQRYVDYTKQGDDFVYPLDLDQNQKELLNETFEFIRLRYETLRATKMKKEDARAILPNAAITHLVFSSFNQGLQHYIKLRTASDAQEEIRLVANIVRDQSRDILEVW